MDTTTYQPTTSTESRALSLLGQGVPPVTVAASLGITEARISQLLSDEHFAAAVADLRFTNLQKHNVRDSKYDELEDTLLKRMEDCIPLMHRPNDILRAIQVINAAKRRGTSAPDHITNKQTVIQLTIPVQILNQFKANSQNQVVAIGEQTLLTIQSNNLESLSSIGKGTQNGSPALIEGKASASSS